MRLSLKPHPDFQSAAVGSIEVDVARAGRSTPHTLLLRYVLALAQNTLLLPAPAAAERTDDLWKHTCLETFVRTGAGTYFEFNFSPSTQWAAYRFGAYRAGMAPLEIPAPRIFTIGGAPPRYEMRVRLELGSVPELASAPLWPLGLSAIIEEKDGAKSYWSLAHPPGRPDFHHDDSFAYDLP